MIKKLHFSLTLFITYILFYYLLYYDKISSILIALVTAILSTIPDFDWKIYSWANKQILFLKKTKLKYLLLPYYSLLLILNKTFKHRTTTHSIFFSLIFFFLGYILLPFFYLVGLAILFHIVEDCFTISGVKIFYPLSNFELKMPLINTRKDILFQKVMSCIFITLTLIFFIFFD